MLCGYLEYFSPKSQGLLHKRFIELALSLTLLYLAMLVNEKGEEEVSTVRTYFSG